MGTRVTFLGPPILQVGGEKFLTRNEVMRSLLGHLGRDRFHSFRGFEVPLVCGKGSTQRSCSTETGCTSTDTPCFLRKVTKAAVEGGFPIATHATIIKRLERVKADYKRALQNQARMTEEQEEAFMNGMEATFNLFKEDWEGEIERDGLLSEEEKERKLEVMRDYMVEGGTKSLPVLPEVVSPEKEQDREEMRRLQEERKKRQEKEIERRRRERGEGSRKQADRDRSPLSGDLRSGRRRRGEGGGDGEEGEGGGDCTQGDAENNLDLDYDPGDPGYQGGNGIVVPDNILELTTMAALHEKLSVRAHVVMVTAILVALGEFFSFKSNI